MKRTLWLLLIMGMFVNSNTYAQIELDFPPENVVWTSTGTIISAHGSKLAFWNSDGELLDSLQITDTVSGDRLSIGSLALSSDNHYLAIGGEPFDPIGLVFVMDLETKQFVAELENENYIQDIDWSHDGNFIAVGSPNVTGFFGEDAVIFWDMETYTEISRINGEAIEGILNAALIPDNTEVAIISSIHQEIQILEPINGNIITTLSGNTGYPDEIDWSSDGQYIAVTSASSEEPHFLITIWDTNTWTVYSSLQVESSFSSIIWNPIYPIFGVQDSDAVLIFDIHGNLLNTFRGGKGFAWSPDGTQIATGDLMDYTKLNIYDVCTNEEANDEVMVCPEPMDLSN